ncbi:UNVERIFIED_CONTAM: hypothetical protein FKN15_021679 [Acipenser sinensis]
MECSVDYNADHSHLLTEANLLKHEHLLEVASLRLNKGVCCYVKDGRKGFLGARKFAQVDCWLTEVEAERRAGQGQAKAPRFRSASQLVPKEASLFQVFPLHSWSGSEGVKVLEPARKTEMLTVKSLCTSSPLHMRALASYSQILRFHGSCLPVYIAVSILLMYEGQLHSLLTTGHTVELGKALSASAKPYRVMPVINILLYLLSVGWLQAGWSALSLPPLDVPPLSEEGGDWSPLVSLLLFMFGSAIAYWGSALLGLSLSLLSVPLSAIHRPSTSPSSGRLGSRGQISLMVFLVVICWTTCGALALIITYLIYLYKVLKLQMSERTLKHVLNLAPRQSSGRAAGPGVCVKEGGGEAVEALGPEGSAVSCNGSDLVSVSALEDTSEDLYLHLTLLTLLTLPVLLSAPSFIYWTKNLRYSLHLDPDPCWPVAIVLVISAVLLMSSSTASIRTRLLSQYSAASPLQHRYPITQLPDSVRGESESTRTARTFI